jgi:hypothetical protein
MNHYQLHSFVSYLSKPAIEPILAEIKPFLSQENDDQQIETANKFTGNDGELPTDENLRERLVTTLSNPGHIACLLRCLSGYEREVLEYFIFKVGQDFLTYRQIEQGVNGIQPHIFRLGLTALRRKGIIYTVRRQWGEVAYILPADLEALFYSVILKDQGLDDEDSWNQPISSSEIVIQRDKRSPFYVDLFFLLDEIRKAPQAEIPLTQKGTIHKRYIRLWLEKIADRESDLGSFSLSIEHRDTYTNQLAILLDFLSRKKLINWFEGSLRLDFKKTRAWMKLSRQEMSEQFVEYWFTYFLSTVPWIQRYQKDMYHYGRKADEWVSSLLFVEQWEEHYELPTIEQIRLQLKEEILQPLEAFGLIECGETEHGEDAWRCVRSIDTLPDLWIQPTMELYCSGGIPFTDLWQVTNVFTLDKWENMLVLKLAKEKATSFIDRGGSLALWLEGIRSLSKVPIPRGIEDQLLQWQKNQQQVRVSDRTVIEIKDEQLAKAFLQWPEVEKLRIEKVSEDCFLLSIKDRETINQLFSKKGIQVKGKEENILENSQTQNEVQAQRNPSLIKFAKDSALQYKVESVFPELTEAIPAWTSLPPMWTKQFSSYHEQTRRQIIEQAIQHHLKLKMEVESGEIRVISPMDCKVEKGNWICYDQDKTKYKVAHINRVQLLFPELKHS